MSLILSNCWIALIIWSAHF